MGYAPIEGRSAWGWPEPGGTEMERIYGSKYNRDLTTTEIAKLLRKDIKAAVKSGQLPKGKYSITTQYFSMGSSITVRIKDIDFLFLNVKRVLHGEKVGIDHEPIYNESGQKVLRTLEAMAVQYNHDGSDLMTDYHDVRFYFSATYDWEMEAAIREGILARQSLSFKHHPMQGQYGPDGVGR